MAVLTANDFKGKEQARWCPGCGDHAILAALQRALPKVSQALDYSKERYVVVSGIGCSSRLPYYMDTYGFHSIHGRATAISTGIKVANPTLTVWQVCGDGDALAIGGNHFIHAIRRNIDINVLLFNNRIYGLTKGQYSPTSKFGAITKTSPYGTVEHPFNPGSLVLGAKGTFFARSLDTELALNEQIMTLAALHDGCSIIELLTNCVIFNDGAHKEISDPAVKADRTIVLRDGEKMIFGKDKDKGLVFEDNKLKVVRIGEDGYTLDDILVHNPHEDNIGLQMALVDMKGPDFPVALGVIREVQDVTYDSGVREQLKEVTRRSTIHCMDDLLHSGTVWEVK